MPSVTHPGQNIGPHREQHAPANDEHTDNPGHLARAETAAVYGTRSELASELAAVHRHAYRGRIAHTAPAREPAPPTPDEIWRRRNLRQRTHQLLAVAIDTDTLCLAHGTASSSTCSLCRRRLT